MTRNKGQKAGILKRVGRRLGLFLALGWFFTFGYLTDQWGKRFEDIPLWANIGFYVNVIIVVAVALFVMALEVQDAAKRSRRTKSEIKEQG